MTLILTLFVSCDQKVNVKSNEPTLTTKTIESADQHLKIFKLDFDFNVTVGQEEDFEKFKTYNYFKLTRKDSTIFIDSSLTEYEFTDKLFPIVLKTGNNSFELLFEINNRPNKNYLKKLIVKNNKLVGQDKLPTFEGKPIDLNQDGINEYAGVWDYSQIWGDDNNMTAYNPILYYSVTENGVILDSLLTRERNELIYGKFYGFTFSEDHKQSINVLEKFEEELDRIKTWQ